MGTAELNPTSPPSLVTAEGLLRDYSGVICDLVEGEVRMMSPAGFEHGALIEEIAFQLNVVVKSGRFGLVTAAETGFLIGRDPDTVLAPDVGFVQTERIKKHGLPKTFFPEAPALAVEVVSPSDLAEEVDDKARRWLSAGSELVWVVYPSGRSVTVYRSLNEVEILTGDAKLTADKIVPGFSLAVKDLFQGIE